MKTKEFVLERRKRLWNESAMTMKGENSPFEGGRGMFKIAFVMMLIMSATAAFAQKTVPKLFLDSIDTYYANYAEIGHFIDNYGYSAYWYNGQGRQTQSFYDKNPKYPGSNIGYYYLHVLRDVWDRIIDSNQKHLTEITSYTVIEDNLTYKQRHVYDYDGKGNIMREIVMRAGEDNQWGGIVAKTIYVYTHDDKEVLIDHYIYTNNTPTGELTLSSHYKYRYEYDNDGNIIRYSYSGPTGIIRYKNEYTYDAKGNIVEYLYSSSGMDTVWKEVEKNTYKYDNVGNMVERTYSICDPDTKEWHEYTKYEYAYDTNGNIVADITVYVYDARKQKKEYMYDSMGNTTLIVKSYLRGNMTQFEVWGKNEYTYDNIGNLTMYRDINQDGTDVLEPQTWEYTYLPYLETDVILPSYDSMDYPHSIRANVDFNIGLDDLDTKLKGVVSSVKMSVYRDFKLSQRKEEKTISYYWNTREVEETSGVSIKELQGDKVTKLRVYPNPTTGQLTIDCRDVINHVSTVEIYDVVGRKVGTYQFPSFGGAGEVIDAQTTPSYGHPSSGGELAPSLLERAGGEVVIDISHLPAGMYFLKVGNKTARFVKE